MSKATRYERIVTDAVEIIGLEYQLEKTIYCKKPVDDKNGNVKKTKTNPDIYVRDIGSANKEVYIEVTTGSANSEQKKAQARVIKQASEEIGVTIPYVVFSSDYVLKIEKLIRNFNKAPKREKEQAREDLKTYIFLLFRWL